MPSSDLELASLLCSRLCHDLLNPVGSITNGLELLADEKDPDMRVRCMELLAESAALSANKLKFFRLAFGAAGGFGEMVDVREPELLVRGLLPANGRVTLHWAIAADVLPKPTVKILLNLALLGMTALVRGGELAVGAEDRGDIIEIAVQASGERVVLDEETAAVLRGEGDVSDLSARTAAAYMVRHMVVDSGGAIQLSHDANNLVLGATIGR